ncbi:peroxisomal targeting signal 2 receptor isoform X1 [Planococcus citri]|uniref:peroxisomal targeting signal 2 receptor isoform X1 n=1 Tax=Planococcus citri TaxID=170843 RepID=UPI0031F8C5BD
MPTFKTPNRHGYSVKFSSFCSDQLVVATSQYYGFTGGGTLFHLKVSDDRNLVEVSNSPWGDGLFDVVWSECDPDVVVTASGDGTLQLWNLRTNPQVPVQVFREHTKEIYSVDWSQTRFEQLVLSASWDKSIKLWDPNETTSLNTFVGHTELVYNAMWSPLIPSCFASVSGDGMLKIWSSNLHQRSPLTLHAHDAEVLTCSWCKYDQNLIATGGSDGLIRGWDMRNFTAPIFEQKGCEYAVRKIQFSPYHASSLASVSYDFTTRIWDYRISCDAIEVIQHHSEFVYGLDFNVHREGEMADCGWDSLVHVFTPKTFNSVTKMS